MKRVSGPSPGGNTYTQQRLLCEFQDSHSKFPDCRKNKVFNLIVFIIISLVVNKGSSFIQLKCDSLAYD